MKKINKIVLGIAFIVICSTLYTLSSNAYYTNMNKYYTDSRTADGSSGFALHRTSNEFIVDGCGSGTMLDTLTGLCFDKDMNHNGSTLTWSTVNTDAEPTWNNVTKVYSYPSGKVNYPAFSYCEDLSQGGQTDWRLPSKMELHTLLDKIGALGTTCTTLTSFGFTNCQDYYYWTYKEYKASTNNSWTINFNDGLSVAGDKLNTFYVLCVR